MLYVKSRNSFKVRRQKNLLLCRVPKKTHGKPWLCRVSQKNTRQSISLQCAKKTHGKPWLCRVLWFCRVFSWAHSAKIMFVVCPWICARQTMVHTVKSKFPVVNAHTIDYKKKKSNLLWTTKSKFLSTSCSAAATFTRQCKGTHWTCSFFFK